MGVRVGFDGSGREPHPDFQYRLKEFNRAQGYPPVAVRWNPKAQLVTFKQFKRDQRGRKGVVYNAVYVPAWEVGVVVDGLPPGYDTVGERIAGGGRFVKVFDWMEEPSEKVFEYLHLADTASGRGGPSPLERVEASEKLKDEEVRKKARALGAAKAQYYYNWNNPTVSMDPKIKVASDWRYRHR